MSSSSENTLLKFFFLTGKYDDLDLESLPWKMFFDSILCFHG